MFGIECIYIYSLSTYTIITWFKNEREVLIRQLIKWYVQNGSGKAGS